MVFHEVYSLEATCWNLKDRGAKIRVAIKRCEDKLARRKRNPLPEDFDDDNNDKWWWCV